MKKMTIEMPAVSRCQVTGCAYNTSCQCHAKAITVGHADIPGCDTFLPASQHTGMTGIMAGVGACKVTGCRFNDDFECTADNIEVGFHGEEVRCKTYTPR